jgi:peptidyl-prolyl cis-trans isomerase C
MQKKTYINWLAILILIIFMFGCGKDKDNEVKETPATVDETNQTQTSSDKPAKPEKPVQSGDIAVSVDGKVLKKTQLDKEIKSLMNIHKDKIPKDQKKEIQADIKTQLVENFIIHTILNDEIEKRKIQATEKEINEAIDKIKANIPPDKKLDDFLKSNNITIDGLKSSLDSDIKVKKIVMMELGGKAKPTQKEIKKFYNDNGDKFTIPENVHVRHILLTIGEKDDDKIKSEKKEKIENLREQIIGGADFAEVAAKNSDCPSKQNGGDLGAIRKGQTVKPFEDAAFSQEKNVIGPVITTDYGYHVIQVLEHNPSKKITLEEVQEKISNYLEQQKQNDAFAALIKKLRANAKIVVY